jgi:hypothetical protein
VVQHACRLRAKFCSLRRNFYEEPRGGARQRGNQRAWEEHLGGRFFLPQIAIHGNYISYRNPARSSRNFFTKIFSELYLQLNV